MVDLKGKYVHVEQARNFHAPEQKPYPPLYLGGSPPAAHELAAKHVDAHLT